MGKPFKVRVHTLDDPAFTLGEWAKLIEALIAQHGSDKILYTDAGYNNVSFWLRNPPHAQRVRAEPQSAPKKSNA